METVICARCGKGEEVPKESIPEGFKGTAKLLLKEREIGNGVVMTAHLYDGLIYVCTDCVKQGVVPIQ